MSEALEDVILFFRDHPEGFLTSEPLPQVFEGMTSSVVYLVGEGIIDRQMPNPNFYSTLPDPEHPELFVRFVLSSEGREVARQILDRRKKLSEERAYQDAKENAKEAREGRLRVKEGRRSWWQFWLGLVIGHVLTKSEYYFGLLVKGVKLLIDLFH